MKASQVLLLVSSVRALATPLRASLGGWPAPLKTNIGGWSAPLTPRTGGWPATFTSRSGGWPASSGGWGQGRRQQQRLPLNGLGLLREQREKGLDFSKERREKGLGFSREQGPSLGFSQALDYRFPQNRPQVLSPLLIMSRRVQEFGSRMMRAMRSQRPQTFHTPYTVNVPPPQQGQQQGFYPTAPPLGTTTDNSLGFFPQHDGTGGGSEDSVQGFSQAELSDSSNSPSSQLTYSFHQGNMKELLQEASSSPSETYQYVSSASLLPSSRPSIPEEDSYGSPSSQSTYRYTYSQPPRRPALPPFKPSEPYKDSYGSPLASPMATYIGPSAPAPAPARAPASPAPAYKQQYLSFPLRLPTPHISPAQSPAPAPVHAPSPANAPSLVPAPSFAPVPSVAPSPAPVSSSAPSYVFTGPIEKTKARPLIKDNPELSDIAIKIQASHFSSSSSSPSLFFSQPPLFSSSPSSSPLFSSSPSQFSFPTASPSTVPKSSSSLSSSQSGFFFSEPEPNSFSDNPQFSPPNSGASVPVFDFTSFEEQETGDVINGDRDPDISLALDIVSPFVMGGEEDFNVEQTPSDPAPDQENPRKYYSSDPLFISSIQSRPLYYQDTRLPDEDECGRRKWLKVCQQLVF